MRNVVILLLFPGVVPLSTGIALYLGSARSSVSLVISGFTAGGILALILWTSIAFLCYKALGDTTSSAASRFREMVISLREIPYSRFASDATIYLVGGFVPTYLVWYFSGDMVVTTDLVRWTMVSFILLFSFPLAVLEIGKSARIE